MKCVLLFTALLAAWMVSSEAAKTCADIMTCTQGMEKMSGAADESKIKEMCGPMQKMMSCFDEALADCRKQNPDMVDQQMNSIKPTMDQVKKMLQDFCGNGAGTTTVSFGLLLFAILAMFF